MKRIEMQPEPDVQRTVKKYTRGGIIPNASALKKELHGTKSRVRKVSSSTQKFRKLKVGEGLVTTKAKSNYFRTVGCQMGRSISVTKLAPNQHLVERVS